MRFLAEHYRESMSEFFGKLGIPLHGHMTMWRKPDSDEYFVCVHHIALDTEKQDKRAVMGLEQEVLKDLHAKHPEIRRIFLRSDGAGCYKNTPYVKFYWIPQSRAPKVNAKYIAARTVWVEVRSRHRFSEF